MFKRTYSDLSVLTLIVLLGAILRFAGLDIQSLWTDELFSLINSNKNNLIDVINFSRMQDIHPPGFHIILYLVQKVFPSTEITVRAPSAIAGVCAIVGMYLLGRRLFCSSVGLTAAAFTAFLWCPLYYSQEARVYSLLFLFSILSVYFWWGLAHGPRTRKSFTAINLGGYIISGAILCYLQYFGLLLVFFQAIYSALLVALRKVKALPFFAAYAVIGLLYWPWVPGFLGHLGQQATHLKSPGYFFFLYYFGFLFNKSLVLLLLIVPFYLFWLRDFQHSLKKHFVENRITEMVMSPAFILLFWLVVPYLIAHFKSLLSQPVLTYRNLIISAPAVYLLLASGVEKISRQLSIHRSILPLVLSSVFLGHLLSPAINYGMDYYRTPQKPQFREAALFLENHYVSKGDVLIVGNGWEAEYFNFYLRKFNAPLRVTIGLEDPGSMDKFSETLFTKSPRTIWYVRAHRHLFISDTEIFKLLDSSYREVLHQPFYKADVYLFEKN